LEDQKLTGWRMVKRIHEAAVADERDTYVDPASTYTVFTSRWPWCPCSDFPSPCSYTFKAHFWQMYLERWLGVSTQ